MGIWTTNGKSLTVNLVQELSNKWQQRGFKFCWMNMNDAILDENDDTYFESKTHDQKTYRVLKDKVTVKDITGNKIFGHIIHWVRGPCSATPLRDWFIIIPNQLTCKSVLQKP